MNIIETETIFSIDAKVSGRKDKMNIIYLFVEPPHNLYIDRNEIILAQIQACEHLLNYLKDIVDINTINKEIIDLKSSLDLMKYYKHNTK